MRTNYRQSQRQKQDKENDHERRLFGRQQATCSEYSNLMHVQPNIDQRYPSSMRTIENCNCQPNGRFHLQHNNRENRKTQVSNAKPSANYFSSDNDLQTHNDRSSNGKQQDRLNALTDSYLLKKFSANSNEHQPNTQISGAKAEQYRTIERSSEGENSQNSDFKNEKEGFECEYSYGKIKKFSRPKAVRETDKTDKKQANYDSNLCLVSVNKNQKYLAFPETIETYATQTPTKLNHQTAQQGKHCNEYKNMQRQCTGMRHNVYDKQNVPKSTQTQKDEHCQSYASKVSFDLGGSKTRNSEAEKVILESFPPNSEHGQPLARQSFPLPTISEQEKLRRNTLKDYAKEKQAPRKQSENSEYIKMDKMAKKLNVILKNMSIRSNEIANGSELSVKENRKLNRSNSAIKGNNHLLAELTKPTDNCPKHCYTYDETNAHTLTALNKETSKWSNCSREEKQPSKVRRDEDELLLKYQSIKESLGLSKHIPSEIILQETPSEVNSEVSPRAELLHLQLISLFNALDEGGTGELSKSNCAYTYLSSETKCLLGGIFTKIIHKNERMNLKKFIEECQCIAKQFDGNKFQQMISKQRHFKRQFDLKLHEKDTQSERENANNGSGSKVSSGRSEVVKKYEFGEGKPSLPTASTLPLGNIGKRNVNDQKMHCVLLEGSTRQLSNAFIGKRKNSPKSSYLNKQLGDFGMRIQNETTLNQHCLFERFSNRKNSLIEEKKSVSKQIRQKQSTEKPFTMNPTEKREEKRKFEQMCENLNSKLDNYLTSITKKEPTKHCISLQFSQLYKHWKAPKKP